MVGCEAGGGGAFAQAIGDGGVVLGEEGGGGRDYGCGKEEVARGVAAGGAVAECGFQGEGGVGDGVGGGEALAVAFGGEGDVGG